MWTNKKYCICYVGHSTRIRNRSPKDSILLGNWGFWHTDSELREIHDALQAGGDRFGGLGVKAALAINQARLRVTHPQIPPLSPSELGWVDLVPFVLYDSVLMDCNCYDWLQAETSRKQELTFPFVTRECQEVMRILNEQNRLVLVNTRDKLRYKRRAIREMVVKDLHDDSVSRDAFVDALKTWKKYLCLCKRRGRESAPGAVPELLKQSMRIVDEMVRFMDMPIGPYVIATPFVKTCWLYDICSTIVLSNLLDTAFYDWSDYHAIYREKFSRIGAFEGRKPQEVVSRLFHLWIPSLNFNSAKQVMGFLVDRRLVNLRRFAQEFRNEPENITRTYVADTQRLLLEIAGRERRFSHIAGYITLPLGFIPWLGTFVQKAAEETSKRLTTARLRRDFRWAFLLNDIASRTQSPRYEVKL